MEVLGGEKILVLDLLVEQKILVWILLDQDFYSIVITRFEKFYSGLVTRFCNFSEITRSEYSGFHPSNGQVTRVRGNRVTFGRSSKKKTYVMSKSKKNRPTWQRFFFFPVKIKISSVKIFDDFRISVREFFFPSVKKSWKLPVKSQLCTWKFLPNHIRENGNECPWKI